MPPPIPDDQIAALRELVFQRRKIDAIRLYREITGLGLKESKEAVEELESSLTRESPERFVARPQNKGCLGLVLLVVIAAVAVAWLVRR